ncbi:MAG: 6-carboxytetrahydropterin synthase QueD [Candidatus Thorarchaeota archaeon]|nr:MAG: 6-carboxytetrahydropterin synthase QueD [Candidatus Thorarchaeota archaeon]
MYEVHKTMTVAGAHHLNLNYESRCSSLHGHNWRITVVCRVKDDGLDVNGMVVDFTDIKKIVNKFDHANLNDFVVQPTAENIAKYLYEEIPHCARIEVEETEGNKVVYEPDRD